MSKNDTNKVSVVIATRDRPELLKRALAGVLTQDFDGQIEVVLVFDQSEPDFSLESETSNRSVVVTSNARSQGLAGARNSGIDKSSGNWIAFCDDDDQWLEGKLSAQFDALASNKNALAACTGIYINYKDKDTPRIPIEERLTFEGFLEDRMTEVHPSSWLIQKDLLVNQVGLVDEEIPGSYAEDYDLFLRTAKTTEIAVASEPLVRVWWHGASFFFERWKMIDEALQYILDKHPEFSDNKKGLARIKGQQAVAKAAMKKRKPALKTAFQALKLNPLEKRSGLAVVVALGLPAEKVLHLAHRFGKGI